MRKRTHYNFNLLLLLTAGIVATVFSSECAQTKVKTTIKNGVTSLPEEAFAGCQKLKEVSIAASVKSIGALTRKNIRPAGEPLLTQKSTTV